MDFVPIWQRTGPGRFPVWSAERISCCIAPIYFNFSGNMLEPSKLSMVLRVSDAGDVRLFGHT